MKPIASVILELITLIDPLETTPMTQLNQREELLRLYGIKIKPSGMQRHCNYGSFSENREDWLEL